MRVMHKKEETVRVQGKKRNAGQKEATNLQCSHFSPVEKLNRKGAGKVKEKDESQQIEEEQWKVVKGRRGRTR